MEDEELKSEGEKPADPLAELSGTALRAYRVLLRSQRPVGVRELQRKLGLKSPSTARHHLERLVQLGLARRERDGYRAVPPRAGLLKAYILIRGRLVPRTLLLTAFLATATIAYTVTPGRDPVAATVLAAAAAAAAYDAATLAKALKELEGG